MVSSPSQMSGINNVLLSLLIKQHQHQQYSSLLSPLSFNFTPPNVFPNVPNVLTPHTSSNSINSASSVATPSSEFTPKRRNRRGGASVKTAEVWRFFEQLPPPEQAATCNICRKIIKATNSSTTGMIRHLRSCHHPEYNLLQDARNKNSLLKSITNLGPNSEQYAKTLKELMEQPRLANTSLESVGSPNPSEDQSSSFSCSDTFDDFKHNLVKENVNLGSSFLSSFTKDDIKHEEGDECSDHVEDDVPDEGLKEEGKLMEKLVKEEGVKENDPLNEKWNNQIARMLIVDHLPTSMIGNPGFRAFISNALPHYQIPSVDEFESSILPSVRKALGQEYLQEFLKNNQLISS